MVRLQSEVYGYYGRTAQPPSPAPARGTWAAIPGPQHSSEEKPGGVHGEAGAGGGESTEGEATRVSGDDEAFVAEFGLPEGMVVPPTSRQHMMIVGTARTAVRSPQVRRGSVWARREEGRAEKSCGCHDQIRVSEAEDGRCLKTINSSLTFSRWPRDLRRIARIGHGGQLEVLLRLKQAGNAAFSFLLDGDPLHPYYLYLKSWGEGALDAEYVRQQRLQAQRAEEKQRRMEEEAKAQARMQEEKSAQVKGPSSGRLPAYLSLIGSFS